MQTLNGERTVRLAFFDVDGVLSAPQYPVPAGDMAIGFTLQGWLDYCETTGEDGYRFCRALPCVKEFASELKAEGARLCVLSTCHAEQEPAAKITFIREHYPDLFDEYLFVWEDAEKTPTIEQKAAENGCSLQECLLVEDTYSTLLSAFQRGILCVHISNIIAGNISR